MQVTQIKITKKFISGTLKGFTIEDIIPTVEPATYLQRYAVIINEGTVLGDASGFGSPYIITKAEIV